MNHVFIAILMMFSASSAWAGEFVYRAYNFETSPNTKCVDVAQELGQKLAQQQNVTVVGSACDFDNYTDKTTLFIRYQADEELHLVSTYRVNRYFLPNSFYATANDCRAAYDKEWNLFRVQTGLEPIVAYCAQKTKHDSLSWYVHIDAFGQPQRLPDYEGWFSSKVQGMDPQTFYTTIQQRLADVGYLLSNMAWRPEAFNNSISLQIWRGPEQKELNLRSEILSTLPGLETCQRAADDINAQLNAREDFFHLISYCSSPYAGPRNFDLVTVLDVDVPRVSFSAEKFSSISECQLSLESLLNQQRVIHGERVLVGLCGAPRHDASGRQGFRAIFLLK